VTKHAFEKLLNSIYGMSFDRHGGAGQLGARKRPWGTWLRSADREHFNAMYAHFNETGKMLSDETREVSGLEILLAMQR
jgi:hypothetical protein